MHLSFEDAALAQLCNCGHLLQERWGSAQGLAVGRRLLLLSSAPDLDAVRSIPTCRAPSESETAEWNMTVRSITAITFIPQQRVPATTDGRTLPAAPPDTLLITSLTAIDPEGASR